MSVGVLKMVCRVCGLEHGVKVPCPKCGKNARALYAAKVREWLTSGLGGVASNGSAVPLPKVVDYEECLFCGERAGARVSGPQRSGVWEVFEVCQLHAARIREHLKGFGES